MESDSEPRSPGGHRGTDLTTGSIPRHLIAFAVPMLIGSALQTAYSLVNAIWVGRGLGTNAIVAVTVSFPLFFVLMAVAGGLTMGTTILVSQAYGARDLAKVDRIIRNSVVLATGVSAVCLVVGHFAGESMLRIMQTPEGALALSVSYFRLFIWTIPCTFGMFLIASILRGVGDSKTPLYFQAVSVGTTALLDPLLMFGWLGMPRLGLNGTAVATIFSQAVALIVLAIHLHRKAHIASPKWTHLRADWETSSLTMRIGIPSMFQQAFISLGMVFMTGLVNGFGKSGAAGFGVAMRIDQLAFMPAMTVGMAVSTLAGQNIGAMRHDRVRDVFKYGLLVSCGLTAIPSLLALTIPHFLIRLFVQDPAVIAVGVGYLRVVGAFYLLFAVMFVSNGIINGAGHTLITSLISVISLWGIRVPLAAFLSHHLHRIEGIWYAMAISFVAGTLISLGYYASGRWRRPIRAKRELAVPVAEEIA